MKGRESSDTAFPCSGDLLTVKITLLRSPTTDMENGLDYPGNEPRRHSDLCGMLRRSGLPRIGLRGSSVPTILQDAHSYGAEPFDKEGPCASYAPALRDKNEQRLHGSWDWGPRLEKHNILQAALSLELLLLLSLLGAVLASTYHTCPSRNGGFGLDCPQQVTQRLSTQYPELKDTSFRCSTDKRLSSDVANLCNHDASVMYVALERADSCPH